MATVDVHTHLMPDSAFSHVPEGLMAYRRDDAVGLEVLSRGRGRAAPPDLRFLDLHRSLQEAKGVDVSLLSPWIDMVKAPLDSAVQQAWCRALNTALADITEGTGHSRFLAALPDLDGTSAADELEVAIGMGAVGGELTANPEQGSLSRPDLEPLWAAAERMGAPLVLHPGEFAPPPRLEEFFMVNLVGNPFETTLAVGALLGAQVPDRHPELKLVLVHGGGFFPYQYARMTAGFARWPTLRDRRLTAPSDYLRWFSYDTVLFDDPPTRYLLDLVGDERVMAGSDCPFTMNDHRPFLSPSSLGLDPAGAARVIGGNAVRLFDL